MAAWKDQQEIVKFFIEKDSLNLDVQNGQNLTALHLAVFNCNYEMVQLLIRSSLQLRTSGGWTPLNIAASRCQVTKRKKIFNIF
jgi:ankyrin repeat protein